MTVRTIIALTLFLSVVLIGLLGIYVNDGVLERVQEQRFEGMIGELRARFETDLRIGLELPENVRAQTMIEDAVARTPALQSIEVDSEQGTVLFDSDRALRGQRVPDAWRDAALAAPMEWRVLRQDEHSLGAPLHDAMGETVGYLVSTYEGGRGDGGWRRIFVRVLGIASGTAGLALLAGGLATHFARLHRAADLARLRSARVTTNDDAVAEAARVLADAREALTRVEHEAQRIAGIEP